MFEIAAKIRLTVVKLTINFLFLNEDYLLTNELESSRLPRFKTSEGFADFLLEWLSYKYVIKFSLISFIN